jgi:hypothetical protein
VERRRRRRRRDHGGKLGDSSTSPSGTTLVPFLNTESEISNPISLDSLPGVDMQFYAIYHTKQNLITSDEMAGFAHLFIFQPIVSYLMRLFSRRALDIPFLFSGHKFSTLFPVGLSMFLTLGIWRVLFFSAVTQDLSSRNLEIQGGMKAIGKRMEDILYVSCHGMECDVMIGRLEALLIDRRLSSAPNLQGPDERPGFNIYGDWTFG